MQVERLKAKRPIKQFDQPDAIEDALNVRKSRGELKNLIPKSGQQNYNGNQEMTYQANMMRQVEEEKKQ